MPRHFSDLQAGTSGYLNMASDWVATGDFDIEFKFMTRIADIEIMLGTSVGASNFIACINGTFSVTISGAGVISASNTINRFAYHVCRLTRTGSAVTAYVDGVQVGTGTSSSTFTLSSMGHFDGGTLPLNGYIADVSLGDVSTPSNSLSWAVSEATASTEDSTPSGNAITYVNTPAADRFEFTESADNTHWWGENGDILELGDQQQAAARLIILAGQSNAVGDAPLVGGVDDVYTTLGGRAVQFDYEAQARKGAFNPLAHQGPLDGFMGLWRTMVLGMTGRKLLVPVSQSATSFDANNWNPGDPQYSGAVTSSNAAYLSNTNNTDIQAFVWLQGESDVLSGSTTYLADLQAMRTGMITDITEMTTDTLWVCVEIQGPDDDPTGVAALNADLQTFVDGIPNGALVTTGDLNLYDQFHFDAPSLRTIGDRVATAINSFEPASESSSAKSLIGIGLGIGYN